MVTEKKKSWQQKQKERIAQLQNDLIELSVNPESERSKEIKEMAKIMHTVRKIQEGFPSQYNIYNILLSNVKLENTEFIWDESIW